MVMFMFMFMFIVMLMVMFMFIIIQQNLDITIPDIAIFLCPPCFLQYINDVLFITIIVSILGPKVRIYTRYRYIYTDLYRLMPTYLTYADHMLES
jgi:hypothetical protein